MILIQKADTRKLTDRLGERPNFRSWPIYLIDPEGTREVREPGSDEDAGTITIFSGDLLLDPAQRRVLVRPNVDSTPKEIDSMKSNAVYRRNSTTMGMSGVGPDDLSNLTGVLLIHSFSESQKVRRCTEVNCDGFMGWHREGQASPHTAADFSTDAFRCRLILKGDKWILDVQAKTRMSDDIESGARALAEALNQVAVHARSLNGLEDLMRTRADGVHDGTEAR